MALYNADLNLRAARERYFELNNFVNGGYGESRVKMKAGPVPIWFPNTVARVKAVKFHDLHHVLTEYPTTWRGEAEIGAWEVATGCAEHYQGWPLNMWAFTIGLVINPRGAYRAFMRGRQSRNLYYGAVYEELLGRKVGDVRRELSLDKEPAPPTPRDRRAFVLWALASVTVYVGTWVVALAPRATLALLMIQLANNKHMTFWSF